MKHKPSLACFVVAIIRYVARKSGTRTAAEPIETLAERMDCRNTQTTVRYVCDPAAIELVSTRVKRRFKRSTTVIGRSHSLTVARRQSPVRGAAGRWQIVNRWSAGERFDGPIDRGGRRIQF